jgi:hypothetical protein
MSFTNTRLTYGQGVEPNPNLQLENRFWRFWSKGGSVKPLLASSFLIRSFKKREHKEQGKERKKIELAIQANQIEQGLESRLAGDML